MVRPPEYQILPSGVSVILFQFELALFPPFHINPITGYCFNRMVFNFLSINRLPQMMKTVMMNRLNKTVIPLLFDFSCRFNLLLNIYFC